jgi:hypothetical protein
VLVTFIVSLPVQKLHNDVVKSEGAACTVK